MNNQDNNFVNGLMVKAPHQNAPDFVKGKISIKKADLIEWLAQQDGEWVNADIKVSKAGKWYVQKDNWKPDGSKKKQEIKPEDELPYVDVNDEVENPDEIPF